MKKLSTIVLILAVLSLLVLTVACNLDAADGIYSEVASSTERTDVVTRSFVGKHSDKYYYLSDEGLFRLDDGRILSNTDGHIIRSAYLDASGNIVVLTQDAATRKAGLTYHAANGSGYDDPVVISEGTAFRGLLTNGLAYGTDSTDTGNIYKISGSTATAKVSDVDVVYALESDDYAFFSVKNDADEYVFYVLDSDGNVQVNIPGSSTAYIGFQPRGTTGDYMLLSYDSSKNTFKAYKLTSTGITEDPWFTLNSSIQYAYSTQAASFYYVKDTKEYIAVKCSSYFDIYNITDNTVESIDKGFATTLRTAEITNIKRMSGLVFVCGTKSSMLYEIDMEHNTYKQL